MKKIFLFGRFIRIAFIISISFIIYAIIDMCIKSSFEFKNILFAIIVFIFAIFGLLFVYSLGIIINYKNNKFKLIVGLTKQNRYERELCDISSLDVEKVLNIGMNFIINYKNGHSERIYYKFYRISFVEESQFKRIKKQLSKIKI